MSWWHTNGEDVYCTPGPASALPGSAIRAHVHRAPTIFPRKPIGSDPLIRRLARYGNRLGVLGSRQERSKYRWSGGSQSIDVGRRKQAGQFFCSARLRRQPVGRFQNVDESAYYKYVLKRAGIRIHCCAEQFEKAEQFENDGNTFSFCIERHGWLTNPEVRP
jgi:hypothetical protein